jgi:hypothetical protein
MNRDENRDMSESRDTGDGRKFSREDLDSAVHSGIIEKPLAETLWGFLVARAPRPDLLDDVPGVRFDLTHLLWYAGALITMSAMGLFSTLAFSSMGGTGLAFTGLAYGAALWFAGDRFWKTPATRTPGGLLIAAAIAMVPLIVFGIQSATNAWAGLEAPGNFQSFYKYIKAGWLPMELATLVVSVLAARRYPFAFIAFPAAFCLWFLSMDIAAYLGGDTDFSFALRRQVSLWFGIGLFLITWLHELKPRKADHAFWLHLVAAMTFWGGLTFQSSSSELSKALYCLINVGLFGLSLYMGRRVYSVFGVVGVMIYLGHLAYEVFKDSLLFPFALSLFGIGIVALGIFIAKRRSSLERWLESRLPEGLHALRPLRARPR